MTLYYIILQYMTVYYIILQYITVFHIDKIWYYVILFYLPAAPLRCKPPSDFGTPWGFPPMATWTPSSEEAGSGLEMFLKNDHHYYYYYYYYDYDHGYGCDYDHLAFAVAFAVTSTITITVAVSYGFGMPGSKPMPQ